MPDYGGYGIHRKLTWRTMAPWRRKQFYRDNETRVSRGQKPLPKP